MVVYLSNSRMVNERQGGRLGPGVGKLISVCDGLRVAASSGVVCVYSEEETQLGTFYVNKSVYSIVTLFPT